MEEKEYEEEGISFSKLLHLIFSQKWVLLAVLIAVTLAGTLGMYFGVNNSKRSYTASFVLNLPTSTSNNAEVGNNYVYPDGQAFYFSDMVSLSNLQKVKDSDEAFGGIDVNALSSYGDISVSRSAESQTAGSQDNKETVYTITAKAKYFSSADVARKFINAVANIPGAYLTEMNIDYDSYIVAAEGAVDYESEVGYLKDQINYLIEQYNNLIKEHRADFVVSNGKTLQNCVQELRTYLDTKYLDNLITSAVVGGYLKHDYLVSYYEVELRQINDDIEDAQSTLDALLNGTSELPQNAQIIKDQADKVTNLKRRKTNLERYVANANTEIPEAYLNNLQTAYTTVKGYTQDYKAVANTVYGITATVSFTTSNVITTTGETSIIKAFLISFVAGFVLACIVSYIVGKVLLNKKHKAVSDIQPVESALKEVSLQAAATDDTEDDK